MSKSVEQQRNELLAACKEMFGLFTLGQRHRRAASLGADTAPIEETVEGILARAKAAIASAEEGREPGPEALHVYTDGACSGNPGPGGWGYYVKETDRKFSGPLDHTTNNQAELRAVLEVVLAAPEGFDIIIHTDSQNVVGWLSQGWRRNSRDIATICEAIESTIRTRDLSVEFVKVPRSQNRLADGLAKNAVPKE